MEVARYRALKLLCLNHQRPSKNCRNGGSPIQGIETSFLRDGLFGLISVEMEVARYRALKHCTVTCSPTVVIRRNGGSPMQGIETLLR